jgi:hypothetical protein
MTYMDESEPVSWSCKPWERANKLELPNVGSESSSKEMQEGRTSHQTGSAVDQSESSCRNVQRVMSEPGKRKCEKLERVLLQELSYSRASQSIGNLQHCQSESLSKNGIVLNESSLPGTAKTQSEPPRVKGTVIERAHNSELPGRRASQSHGAARARNEPIRLICDESERANMCHLQREWSEPPSLCCTSEERARQE